MRKAMPAGRQGFTLIELLVTIAIMGIMLGAGMATFNRTSRIQALEGAADKLRQTFQVAKSNALAGKKDCTPGVCGCTNLATDLPLAGWVADVYIYAGHSLFFTLNGYCGPNSIINANTNFTNDTVGTILTLNAGASINVTHNVSQIGFKPLGNGAVADGLGLPVTYTLIDMGATRTVTVNADGSILLQ